MNEFISETDKIKSSSVGSHVTSDVLHCVQIFFQYVNKEINQILLSKALIKTSKWKYRCIKKF